MKPFPEAVQKAFPCAPGRVPDRPWWRYAVWPCQTRLIPELEAGSNKQYRAEDADDAAEADAKYPIPHPGYRAGQVWAKDDGSSVLVAYLAKNERMDSFIGFSADNGQHTVEDFVAAYPYLIADPACPHLAPWSPVEIP